MIATQHLALNCRDRRAQEAFYTEHFGFRRARVFNSGQPDEFVMLRLGGMCLELFTAKRARAGDRGGEQAIGFLHLAFDVDGIDEAVAKLQAAGVKTDPIIDCDKAVPGLRICFFDDPEGNRIELMEGWKDDPAAATAL